MKLIDEYIKTEKRLEQLKKDFKTEVITSDGKIKYEIEITADPIIKVERYNRHITKKATKFRKEKYYWSYCNTHHINSEDWNLLKNAIDKQLNKKSEEQT